MAHRSFPSVGPDLDGSLDDDLPPPATSGGRSLGAWIAPLVHVPPVPPRVLALGATVVAVALGWWLLRPVPAPIEAAVPLAASASERPPPASAGGAGTAGAEQGEPTSTSAPAGDLVVQAAGAVASPGVYRLPPDARVDDLIRAAGGYAPGADPDRVNLAATLTDGERIWVPTTDDEAAPEVIAGGGGAGPAGSGASGSSSDAAGGSSELVDLNTAGEAELDALPGVGPATAAAILAHRDQVGGFRSVEELIDVRGIGEAKLEQLRPLVRV